MLFPLVRVALALILNNMFLKSVSITCIAGDHILSHSLMTLVGLSTIGRSHAEEKAEYTQQTFQIELPLTDYYQINMQYFKYEFKRKDYYYDDPLIDPYGNPSELDLTNVPLPDFCDPNDVLTCLLPYEEYNPGMGAPFAILSSETIFISLEKTLLDNDLKLTLSTLMDLDKGFGELASLEADYNMGNGLNAIIGLTKIIGDDEVENYAFNDMKDFSNLRFEIKYNF